MSRTLTITRRAAWLLIGAAAWTIYIWTTRVYTIARQNQTTSFKVAHYVLAAVSIVLGIAIGTVGVRALRRAPA
ncbi:MAG TPA: hypothetical protein VGB64_07935 [Actinomycetota bacterium]